MFSFTRELDRIKLVCDVVKIPLIERWIDQPYRPGIVLLGNGARDNPPGRWTGTEPCT